MTSNHNIDGQTIEIDWEFATINDVIDETWVEWLLKGTDAYGNRYTATCQADEHHPEDTWDKITEIEKD